MHVHVHVYNYIYEIGTILTIPNDRSYELSVFEIKGALGARRAHFRGRAHVFRTCAPDVCTFIHSIIIVIY